MIFLVKIAKIWSVLYPSIVKFDIQSHNSDVDVNKNENKLKYPMKTFKL